MKKLLIIAVLLASCAGKTGKTIEPRKQQSLDERQNDLAAAPFDEPIDNGDRKDIFLCVSPVMDSGKFSRVFVEEMKDGSRVFHVELTFEKGATENFTVLEPRVGEAAFYDVSEAVIAAYGLAPIARYQVAFIDDIVTVRIVGGESVESLHQLGFPPADCRTI